MAERLARAQFRVAAVDRKQRPGDDVCCTGIVGTDCLNFMQIPDTLVHHRPRGAVFVSPSGRHLVLERDQAVAAVVDRSELERVLVHRARAAGARVVFGLEVGRVNVTSDRVMIEARGPEGPTTLEARAVVLASGPVPELAARLGLGRVPGVWVGAQVEVALERPGRVVVLSDQTLAPGGFAWLVPTRPGKALAGMAARKLPDRHLGDLLDRLRQAHGVRGAVGPVSVRTIPLGPMPRTHADRVLVVGAAAGQVKPTTGGGIYWGALCGGVAAEVLENALRRDDLSAHGLAAYERRWRDRVGRELGAGRRARHLLDRMGNRHLEHLFTLAVNRDLARRIRTMPVLPFDWHGRQLLELVSWLFTPGSAQADGAVGERVLLPECRAS